MKHHIFHRYFCLLLLGLCALVALPLGRIVARSVRFLPDDMTGPMSHVKDRVGRDTYLLKVKIPYPGAKFDGVIKYEDMTGEYYVWMEDQAKLLDVRFPGCEVTRINLKDLLGEPLTAPRTYELTLDLDALEYRTSDPAKQESSKSSGNNVPASNPDGYRGGHGYVDLGLPSGTLWADRNIGAPSPWDYGNYFAWGEVSDRPQYTEKTSATYGKAGIGDISGNPSMDAASAKWKSGWRLPTKSECEELISECSWTWQKHKGRAGYVVTGPNGKSIFLPAAGLNYNYESLGKGDNGGYQCGLPQGTDNAYGLSFDRLKPVVSYNYRYYGRSIRPVLSSETFRDDAAGRTAPQETFELAQKYFAENNIEKAYDMLFKSMEAGNRYAAFAAGPMEGGYNMDDPDVPMLLEWFNKAAEGGDLLAMNALASYYCEVEGAYVADDSMSFYWFQKAAEKGSAIAMFNLGALYSGDNVEYEDRDYSKAIYWYEKSAENGYVQAMWMVGIIYSEWDAGQDLEKAEYWWRKAADAGHEMAKEYLKKYFGD